MYCIIYIYKENTKHVYIILHLLGLHTTKNNCNTGYKDTTILINQQVAFLYII